MQASPSSALRRPRAAAPAPWRGGVRVASATAFAAPVVLRSLPCPCRRAPPRRPRPVSAALPPRLAQVWRGAARQTPVRNAHIVVLTDFSANPLAAMRDRAADPVFLSMLLAAALLGAALSRLLTLLARRRQTALPPASAALVAQPSAVDVAAAAAAPLPNPPDPLPPLAAPSPGENAVWLNLTLSSLWRLFRKSTAALTKEVLQPALNALELPSFVRSIEITRFSLGATPALVRQISRIPSRSLSDIHYRFTGRLVGADDGFAELCVSVALPLPGPLSTFDVPVRVYGLDVDARFWLAVTTAPFPPFLRAAQWALADMPDLRLSISLGDFLPLTAIPLLSTALTRILTVELPKQFLFPKVQRIDLAPREDDDTQDVGDDGVTDAEDAMARYPKLAALFDLLDVDDSKVLSAGEVARGLVEWGFASPGDHDSIAAALDQNDDRTVRVDEFVQVWPRLKDLFVPQKFRGVLSGVLVQATELRPPTFGPSDPFVVLSVEGQSTKSPKDSQTSAGDKEKGDAVWKTGWELYVQQPRAAMLRIEVCEGSPWTFYRKSLNPPALPTTHSGSGKPVNAISAANRVRTVIGYATIPVAQVTQNTISEWVKLIGGGYVKLELQYNEFVDPDLEQ